MQLNGKTVLVTGASQGIGAATAGRFAAKGAQVLMVARDADALAEQVRTITAAGGKAVALPTDLSDVSRLLDMTDRVREEYGAPDVLVNNAGSGRWLFLEETEPADLIDMIAVPCTAALLLTQAFMADMLKRRSGWVVNVNSPTSRVAIPGAVGYSAARWALRGLTESLRLDLRGTGVGVSEVIPGKVLTNYFEANPGVEERVPRVAQSIPPLRPEQVGDAVVRAVEQERTAIFLPWQLKAIEVLERVAPGLPEWLNWRTGARRDAAPAEAAPAGLVRGT